MSEMKKNVDEQYYDNLKERIPVWFSFAQLFCAHKKNKTKMEFKKMNHRTMGTNNTRKTYRNKRERKNKTKRGTVNKTARAR